MPEQARVTSVDALEAFRTSLILYVSKARPTLEEVSSDVVRTRLWLENDQRTYWRGEIRRRTKELEEARGTLYRASLASLRQPTVAEQMAVRRAKESLEEAEAKLKLIRKWTRDFDSRVEPIARHLEKLHTILSNVLPRAVAQLGSTIKTLEAYAETVRSGVPAGAVPAEATPSAGPPAAEALAAPPSQAGADSQPAAAPPALPGGTS